MGLGEQLFGLSWIGKPNYSSIWLIDLSRQLPEAQLDGFDISNAHFPPKDELPKNVKLGVHDATAPVPMQYTGKYDVVHVGRINLFIRGEDPAPLLKNFISMLSNTSKDIFKNSNDLEDMNTLIRDRAWWLSPLG